MKSCRIEKNICVVGDLQEQSDLTYMDSCKNKGFRHQKIHNNSPCPLPLLATESALPKSFKEFEGACVTHLLALPCSKSLSPPAFQLGLTAHQSHNLPLGNNFSKVSLGVFAHGRSICWGSCFSESPSSCQSSFYSGYLRGTVPERSQQLHGMRLFGATKLWVVVYM